MAKAKIDTQVAEAVETIGADPILQFERELADARVELEKARDIAMPAALRVADNDFFIGQGLLTPDDPRCLEAQSCKEAAFADFFAAQEKSDAIAGQLEQARQRIEAEAKRPELERRLAVAQKELVQLRARGDARGEMPARLSEIAVAKFVVQRLVKEIRELDTQAAQAQ